AVYPSYARNPLYMVSTCSFAHHVPGMGGECALSGLHPIPSRKRSQAGVAMVRPCPNTCCGHVDYLPAPRLWIEIHYIFNAAYVSDCGLCYCVLTSNTACADYILAVCATRAAVFRSLIIWSLFIGIPDEPGY